MQRIGLLGAVLVAAAPAVAQVPRDTLQRVEDAFSVMDGRGVAGRYLMTMHVRVRAPGEDGPEDTLEIHEVTIAPDGSKTTRLVKAVEDGSDVTERRRARGDDEEHDPVNEKDHIDTGFLPIGARATTYAFSRPRQRDGALVASFRPATGTHVEDDLLSAGEIAWDPASGDPLWIQLEPENSPPFVSDLDLRFEFARSLGVLHPRLVTSRVRAGIPLVLRVRVDVAIELSEVHLTVVERSAEPS